MPFSVVDEFYLVTKQLKMQTEWRKESLPNVSITRSETECTVVLRVHTRTPWKTVPCMSICAHVWHSLPPCPAIGHGRVRMSPGSHLGRDSVSVPSAWCLGHTCMCPLTCFLISMSRVLHVSFGGQCLDSLFWAFCHRPPNCPWKTTAIRLGPFFFFWQLVVTKP